MVSLLKNFSFEQFSRAETFELCLHWWSNVFVWIAIWRVWRYFIGLMRAGPIFEGNLKLVRLIISDHGSANVETPLQNASHNIPNSLFLPLKLVNKHRHRNVIHWNYPFWHRT